jgi:hypothetical protein
MLEALQEMLPESPKAPEPLLVDMIAPVQQLPEEPDQPEEEPVACEQEPREETTLPPESADEGIEMFARVDLLSVLVAAGWLMEREEDDTGGFEVY